MGPLAIGVPRPGTEELVKLGPAGERDESFAAELVGSRKSSLTDLSEPLPREAVAALAAGDMPGSGRAVRGAGVCTLVSLARGAGDDPTVDVS
mmetsp:Transcript_19689/g.63218  ORF Transcript_19689/g.63218 Transcript_19689/m.63218 type:complete len:93 (+) Transcript_19689:1099-1377(+)